MKILLSPSDEHERDAKAIQPMCGPCSNHGGCEPPL